MLPKNFFKKLTEKIKDLSEDEKMDCFDEDGVLLLKKISETCQKEEKFLMVDIEKFNTKSVSKIINKFNLSVYYKRKFYLIFLTNFKGKVFTRPWDDRYRFLKMLYPDCNEFLKLSEKRDKFFEDMMK